MNKELDDKLCATYPKIFRDRHGDRKKTLMTFGFACGDGWYKIIDELCSKLQKIADLTGIETIAVQIKEKFATLRFYVSYDFSSSTLSPEDQKIWCEIANNVIGMAEIKSKYTCEEYGEYGETRDDLGWLLTLCDKHYEEKKAERAKS